MEVMKKKRIFMIPKAKLAFSIAHCLFVFAVGTVPYIPKPSPDAPTVVVVKFVQLALAMNRSSYTPAIRAPTKQRSINATNRADRRVELRRKAVIIAQTVASTVTINRTLHVKC